MNIKFLGTSSMLGFPRKGCKCLQCSSKDKKDERTRSSLLIDNQILIDAGPDILDQLRDISHPFDKLRASKLRAIIITHAHFDHTDGLKKILPKLNKQTKIYLSQESFQKLSVLKKYQNQVEIIKEKNNYQIGKYKFQFLKLPHWQKVYYWAPIIDKKLIYATDFFCFTSQFLKEVKKTKVLILNGSLWKKSAFGHLAIKEQIKYLEKNLTMQQFNNLTIYFSHNGHIKKTHQEMQKLVQKWSHSTNVRLAYDGLSLKI